MRILLVMTAIVLLMANCQSGQKNNKETEKNTSNVHKVVVQEVLQAEEYTYLKVKENDKEQWLAVESIDAKPGQTYYYEGGFEMNNFESKELKELLLQCCFLIKYQLNL